MTSTQAATINLKQADWYAHVAIQANKHGSVLISIDQYHLKPASNLQKGVYSINDPIHEENSEAIPFYIENRSILHHLQFVQAQVSRKKRFGGAMLEPFDENIHSEAIYRKKVNII